MRSAISAAKKIADQSPRDGEVHVLPVQGNVFMLVADGTNITASIGPEGVALVMGSAQMSDKILATVSQLAQTAVTPTTTNQWSATCPGVWGWSSPYIHTVISSRVAHGLSAISSTPAWRPSMAATRRSLRSEPDFGRRAGRGFASRRRGTGYRARERAQPDERACGKTACVSAGAWLPVSYFDEFYKLPAYFNGEGITVYLCGRCQHRRRQHRAFPPLGGHQRR